LFFSEKKKFNGILRKMAGKENEVPKNAFVVDEFGNTTPPPDWCNELGDVCTGPHNCTGHPNEIGFKCHEIWCTTYHKGGICNGHRPITDVNKANAALQRYAAQLEHAKKLGLNPLNFAVKRKLRKPLKKVTSSNETSLAKSHSEEVSQVAKVTPPHPKIKDEPIPIKMRPRSNSRNRREKKRREEFPAIPTTSAAAAIPPVPHWPIAEDKAEARLSTMIAVQLQEMFDGFKGTLREVVKEEIVAERVNIDAAISHALDVSKREVKVVNQVKPSCIDLDDFDCTVAAVGQEIRLSVDSSQSTSVMVQCFGSESETEEELLMETSDAPS
jgi:hypothetical protein